MALVEHLPTLVWVCCLLGFLKGFFTAMERTRTHKAFMQANNCEPSSFSRYPLKDPFMASDMIINMVKAAKQRKLLDFWRCLLEKYNYTYMTVSSVATSINTAEPENAKAVFTTNFSDWSVAPARQAFQPAMGESLFMTDGSAWSHSRSLIRPIFVKDHLGDLELLEGHVQALIKMIPANGETVDMQPLFHRLALDASTEFIFGQSTHTLRPDMSDEEGQLHVDFDLVLKDAIDRVRMGRLYRLFKDKRAAAAIANVRSTASVYAREALKRVQVAQSEKPSTTTKQHYSFLDELAVQTGDVKRMTDESTSLLFGGRDTTASLLSHLWYLLSKHPEVWDKLLAEVDELEGARPTYEWIKSAKYLRYCEHEAMRLFPVIPQFPGRTANRDTVIPLGGGPDGRSPLYVPKGTRLNFSQWTANHRKDIWGEDAEIFKPSRWETLRPGWNYIPFGAGPRICIGQQLALTETYYVTVRLMQHFRRIETRDERPWVEKFTTTICSENGVLIGFHAE